MYKRVVSDWMKKFQCVDLRINLINTNDNTHILHCYVQVWFVNFILNFVQLINVYRARSSFMGGSGKYQIHRIASKNVHPHARVADPGKRKQLDTHDCYWWRKSVLHNCTGVNIARKYLVNKKDEDKTDLFH